MLANEQALNQTAKISSGNLTYQSYLPIWRVYLDSYVGGADYRKGKYLTRYQLETPQEYDLRLQNTPLENHCMSIVSLYKSFLFRTAPVREFNSLEGMPELEAFMKDADHDGRSLNQFMKDAATYSSVFGHCFILVSKPNVGAVTRAEEQQQGARPYVSLLTPLVCLDWYHKRQPSGAYELEYFKYVEEVVANVIVVKEYFKDKIITTHIDDEKKEILEILTEVNGLGEIPVVTVYNIRSIERGLGVSDLTDIADLQKFIYNATSEAVESIRMDSHPSLVATPETRVGTGAGSLILMPENLEPGLKPYILQNSGANVELIYKAIQHTAATIDKIANTGSVRATESRTLSGVAMEVEMNLLSAKLSEKADNLELAEEQMWNHWCKFMGMNNDIEIDYPGEFSVRDTESQIRQLKTAADTNPQNPLVKQAIDAAILDWLEVDQDDIITDTPTVNVQDIQKSIMAGDTDAEIVAAGTTTAELTAAKTDLLNLNNKPLGTITRAQPD